MGARNPRHRDRGHRTRSGPLDHSLPVRSELGSAKVRDLWRFGTAMVGSRLGDVAFHRFDNLAVAAFSGSAALGLYNQAYLIAEMGNKLFAPIIAYLPLNLYAKIQGQSARVQRSYDLIGFWIIRAVAPVGVILLVVPEQLLVILFGDPWRRRRECYAGSRSSRCYSRCSSTRESCWWRTGR